MLVYCLGCEAYSDDERLLGVYASEADAKAAYDAWEDRGYYSFYRIEPRELGAAAAEYEG